MKIAIFTHPLVSNYGGILQAYALQKVLKSMGHEVVTVNRRNKKPTLLRTKLQKLKQAVFKHHSSLILTSKQKDAITMNSSEFIKRNINLSELIENTGSLKRFFKTHDFDAVIVGSDQIWRPPPFTYNIYNSFLDFLKDNNKIVKISNNLYSQFPGSSEDFDASTSTMFLYSFNLSLHNKIGKQEVLNLFSPYINKKGMLTNTSGDTYGPNRYSKSFGYSELSQGMLLLLLSKANIKLS